MTSSVGEAPKGLYVVAQPARERAQSRALSKAVACAIAVSGWHGQGATPWATSPASASALKGRNNAPNIQPHLSRLNPFLRTPFSGIIFDVANRLALMALQACVPEVPLKKSGTIAPTRRSLLKRIVAIVRSLEALTSWREREGERNPHAKTQRRKERRSGPGEWRRVEMSLWAKKRIRKVS